MAKLEIADRLTDRQIQKANIIVYGVPKNKPKGLKVAKEDQMLI